MFLTFTILSEVIYLFILSKAYSFGIINLHEDPQMLLVITSFFFLFLFYFLAFFKTNWEKQNIKIIFAAILAFNITFLFIPFLSSNDLYSYIFTTRIHPFFGENPYFVPYNNFSQDVLYENINTIWANHPTLYGPLFLHIGALLNLIGQNNLGFLTLAFKSLFIGANLINALLIYQISKNKRCLFLFAANPLIIFELAGNSHTESLTILFLLISIYFLHKKPVASFLGFTLSIIVKFYTALFLPLYIIKLWKKGFKQLLYSLFLGILLIVVIYWQYWRGLENFDYLISYYNGQYTSPSLLIYLGQVISGSYTLSFQINTVIFLGFAVVLMYKFWATKADLKQFIFYSFLLYWGYILTKSSLILSWYLILLVLLASLSFAWKKYEKWSIVGIFFVSIYSLCLYYIVR